MVLSMGTVRLRDMTSSPELDTTWKTNKQAKLRNSSSDGQQPRVLNSIVGSFVCTD